MPEQSKTSKPRTGHRETFNQIVLMLIVAFTLRVFVVEAFVIPTGSMATTLKGAHSRFTCDNCGYHYDVNFSSQTQTPGEINIPRVVRNESRVYCPNCGYRVPAEKAETLPIFYGDRILVLKYAYLLREPQRWDVVVFKSPAEPNVYHYSQAYIKRLIGTPGEQIMILDGDIYVANASEPADSDWHIQRKPEVVQDALWRIVNDTDFAPRGLDGAAGDDVPWKSTQGQWKYTRDETGARAFHCSDPGGASTLEFDGNREVTPRRRALSDFLAYDQMPGQGFPNPVSDLKLSFFYRRAPGSAGPLELKLSKRDNLFIAQLDAGSVSLWRAGVASPDDRRLIARKDYAFGDKPVKVEFSNVDYRLRLMLDGQEVLATTPQDYSPDVSALRTENSTPPYPTVAIAASRQVCAISHLSLWRDVFYTVRDNRTGYPLLRGGPGNPVKLGADEYFTLGDNSPLSADGRFWTDSVKLPLEDIDAQAGVVPGRFLLGKAMLVYWPAGFRLFYGGAPDLIPNFGEMRFIH